MTITTHMTRSGLAVLVAAAVAAVCAPLALADPPQGHPVRTAQPDLVERYVASGRGQADLVERFVASRQGETDVVERWVDARAGGPEGYHPKLATASSPTTTSATDWFGWGYAGSAVLAAFALTLVAGVSIIGARRRRIAHS